MITYYNLLGIDAHADAEEIQKAYHRKAQLLHPDRHAGATGSVQRDAEAAMKTTNAALLAAQAYPQPLQTALTTNASARLTRRPSLRDVRYGQGR